MNKKVVIISVIVLVVLVGTCVFLNKINVISFPGQKITIKFDSDGGDKINDLTVKKGEKKNLPNTKKEGYRFTGWYLGDERIFSSDSLNSNVTLVAKWSNKFKVSFNSQRGSQVDSLNLECGQPITLPKEPTRKGYKFMGWKHRNGTLIKDGDVLSCRNITAYAIWEKTK